MEWSDGNVLGEDRIGYFVAYDLENVLDNKLKIKIANSDDEVIGVVSGNASVIGNSYEDQYKDMYVKDEFGRIQYENVTVTVDEYDENGNLLQLEKQEYRMKINPNYDLYKEYIPRSERKEWDIIGLHGQIVVRDDSSCSVGKKCKCNDEGIATLSDEGYLVIERINENIIKIYK